MTSLIMQETSINYEEFEKNYPDSKESLKYEKDSVATIPFQRKGSSDEVAEAIRFLVSDESVFMTGAEITIDGGLVAQWGLKWIE